MKLTRPNLILRRLLIVGGLVALAGSGFFAYQRIAQAESFSVHPWLPGAWGQSGTTPDPNLTRVFNSSGSSTNLIEHVLKHEQSSQVNYTNLKLYYDVPPSVISISTDVEDCRFEAPGSGGSRLRMSIGGQLVYDKPAAREGRYLDVVDEGYSFERANPGQTPSRYRLERDTSRDRTFYSNNYVASQICNSNPPASNYTAYDYNEGCNNWRNEANVVCAGNGNEIYSRGASQTRTQNIGNTCPPNNCQFGSRTFTAPGNLATFDSATGKYVVNVLVELTGYSGGFQHSDGSNIQHQIRFKLSAANGGIFGYATPLGGISPARQFGLGQDRTGDDSSPDGIKLAVPFGLPCTAESASVGTVSIYDVDSVAFGAAYVQIYQRNPDGSGFTLAPDGAFRNPQQNGQYYGSTDWFKANDGANGTAFFDFEMQPATQYLMVLSNPKVAGKNTPKRNVFSVGLPAESINGTINCREELTPRITTIDRSFEHTPSFPIHGDIQTNGGVGGDHNWQVTRIVFDDRPGNMHASLETNTTAPCAHMTSGNGGSGPRDCTNMSNTLVYPATREYDSTFSDSTPYPLGTYICFMTSVRKPTWQHTNSHWRHSNMTCSVSGISPKFQVWGGDMRSEGEIRGSLSTVNGRNYGSWGEYGVAANGTVQNVASGSNLVGGRTGNMNTWSTLTFANTPSRGGFGGVFPTPIIEPGNGVTIIPPGSDYSITSNISHSGTYDSINDIPRRIIIADNINIAPGVTRIDAWLIARNNINTCTTAGPLRDDICDNQLRFNGPVYANTIELRRTAGARLADPDEPAEIFNLRPSIFLSSYAGEGEEPQAITDRVRELPPRF